MSRQKWMIGILLLFVILIFACGGPQQEQAVEEDEGAGLPVTDPEQYAINLWKSDITWYGTWGIMPGTEEMAPSQGNPHGMYGTVYGNKLANAAATGDVGRMPEGAIIVRENYNKEQQLLRITSMSKTNGEWFWAVYNPDGTVELAGDLDICLECHGESQRDMVFFWMKPNDDTE